MRVNASLAPLLLACLSLSAAALVFSACGDDDKPSPGATGGSAGAAGQPSGEDAPAIEGTSLQFEVAADLTSTENYYSFPYPSDLRRTPDGHPDLRGFPFNPVFKGVTSIRDAAARATDFSILSVAYFRGTAPVTQAVEPTPYAPATSSPVLLIDIDAASNERGRLFPTLVVTPPVDDYVPENLFGVGLQPGWMLRPKHRYAAVVLRSYKDANGAALGSPASFETLKAGRNPAGAATDLVALYAPLWETLDTLGVPRADVAAATVFTTDDVVADLYAISEQVRKDYPVTIEGLQVDPDDGAKHPRYCEIVGSFKAAQFQSGKPPFNTDGVFQFDEAGALVSQREETLPVVISLPKGKMPVGGYPLGLYFHGSGGRSTAVVDRGTWRITSNPADCAVGFDLEKVTTPDGQKVEGCHTPGEGPAHVLAPFGIAMAGAALPVNPERLPGAGETAYLNLSNVGAGRDTFRQGAIEQRLFLDALLKLAISPEVVATCEGLELPEGETAFRFSEQNVVATGQSMGGQYTNIIGAIEPRIRAVVPTGAGGYWSYFILQTQLIPNAGSSVGKLLLGTREKLTHLHPSLALFQSSWETVEPMVYMPRLYRAPLEGHPARPVYEPVGLGDSYFPSNVYDAMAVAYGNQQAGDLVWPTMQTALSADNRGGILPYPITDNRTSESGQSVTGVVVQYEGDGIYDPHGLYSQLDSVKYQYGCFFDSFLRTGKATVPAVAPLGSPCP
jgi:hypothetical protein